MDAADEEGGNEEVGVVPKRGGRNADEVSPPVAAQGQHDGGEIHPGLEEVQQADVGFNVRRKP